MKAVTASSKETPCFLMFVAAFRASHWNVCDNPTPHGSASREAFAKSMKGWG